MKTKIILITLFAIAMGYLESAVVVYLREIMYPMGFSFPLASIEEHLAITEIIREAATIIMLLSIAYLAGTYFTERFAWFIYSFAIWDIFYYVFLKILTGWPESLLSWDILFLIPVSWVGPVIAPIITSLSMILLASIILFLTGIGKRVYLKTLHWIFLISGACIIVLSFIWDYSGFILEHYTFIELFDLTEKVPLYELAAKYRPVNFNWMLFILGEIIILITTFAFLRSSKIK